MSTNAEKLEGLTKPKPMLYDMEVFAGKSILTSMTVQATSDEEAVKLVAQSLKINIRKRHALKQ